MPPTLAIVLAWLTAVLIGLYILRRGDGADNQALRLNDGLAQRVASLEAELRKRDRDVYKLVEYIVTLRGVIARIAPNEVIPPLPPLENGAGIIASPDTAKLRRILTQRLSLDELKSLAFDKAPSFDADGYTARGELARDLIEHLQQRGKLGEIVLWLKDNRADVKLD